MRKLKLDLDQLAVDSFDTQTPPKREGTVFGEQYTWTCPGCPSCEATCDDTCNITCGGSCGADCLNMPITYTCE